MIVKKTKIWYVKFWEAKLHTIYGLYTRKRKDGLKSSLFKRQTTLKTKMSKPIQVVIEQSHFQTINGENMKGKTSKLYVCRYEIQLCLVQQTGCMLYD